VKREKEKFEVLSELDPIGTFRVAMMQDKEGIYIDVRSPDGKLFLIQWSMDDLARLRQIAEQKVTKEMPKEEADKWRDVMVEMIISMRGAIAPLFEELFRDPWYVRFWRLVGGFFMPREA